MRAENYQAGPPPGTDRLLSGLRLYQPHDLPALKQLLAEARAWPPSVPVAGDDVRYRWRRRGVNPESDVSVLPASGGALAAYFQTVKLGGGTPRLSFEMAVAPRFRYRGVGGALYRLVEERARSLGVTHLTTPVFVGPNEQCLDTVDFLQRRGFHQDSSYWQMRVGDIAEAPPPVWPAGITCRVFRRHEQDAARWAQLIRDCFHEPATTEGIEAQLGEEGVSPDGYFFAVEKAGGLEVGTSRARIDLIGGRPTGYIGTVGVLPAYRGRGIAEALILQTLAYLAGRGLADATLFVENRNTAARKLYSKMGWREVYHTDHYWKRLAQTSDE